MQCQLRRETQQAMYMYMYTSFWDKIDTADISRFQVVNASDGKSPFSDSSTAAEMWLT